MINLDEIGRVHEETTYNDNTVKAEIPVEILNLKVINISFSPDPGVPGQLTSGVITVLNDSDKAFSAVADATQLCTTTGGTPASWWV